MDNLNEVFKIQTDLMENIKSKHPEFWDKEPFEGYRKFMLACAIIHEVIEYQQDLKFKWWKDKQNYKVDEQNRKHVELPDIFHFFLQLCIEEGINPETLIEDYKNKVQINFLRQETKY